MLLSRLTGSVTSFKPLLETFSNTHFYVTPSFEVFDILTVVKLLSFIHTYLLLVHPKWLNEGFWFIRTRHFGCQQRSFSFSELKTSEVKHLHKPKRSAAGLSLSPRDDAHVDCWCCLNSFTLISASVYPKVTREQVRQQWPLLVWLLHFIFNSVSLMFAELSVIKSVLLINILLTRNSGGCRNVISGFSVCFLNDEPMIWSHQTHERGEQTEDTMDICTFKGTDERSGSSLHLLLSSLFLLFHLKSQICADSCRFMKLWTHWTQECFWYDSMKKITALTVTATLWTVCTHAKVFVCVFTCVQHRQGQQHQVGAATGAEHAGKHEEDQTPEGRGQESACDTHGWNTHSVRSPRVSNMFQRTDASVRPRLTNKQTSYCHLQVKGQREVVGDAQEQDWWSDEQQQGSNITSAFF